jgi:hypothetical protein
MRRLDPIVAAFIRRAAPLLDLPARSGAEGRALMSSQNSSACRKAEIRECDSGGTFRGLQLGIWLPALAAARRIWPRQFPQRSFPPLGGLGLQARSVGSDYDGVAWGRTTLPEFLAALIGFGQRVCALARAGR